jgi:hypothetical protein
MAIIEVTSPITMPATVQSISTNIDAAILIPAAGTAGIIGFLRVAMPGLFRFVRRDFGLGKLALACVACARIPVRT